MELDLPLAVRAPGHRVWGAALLRDEQGRVLLYKPPAPGDGEEQWRLPGGELPVGVSPDLGLATVVEAQLGIAVNTGEVLTLSYERLALPEARVFLEPGLHLVFDAGRCRAADVDSTIRADPVLAATWKWTAAEDAARRLHVTERRRLARALATPTAIALLVQPPRHDGAALTQLLGRGVTDGPVPPAADPPPFDLAVDTVVIAPATPSHPPAHPGPRPVDEDSVQDRAKQRSSVARFWQPPSLP